MKRLFHSLRPFAGERRIIAVVMAVWIALVGSLTLIDWRDQNREVFDLAVVEARSTFNRDLGYRRWSTMHGGVYVPPTDQTPPNPYLAHIPDRDVVTTGGKRLTLVNPAYMTRQVHELGELQHGARGHITSLKPIRPENAADPWETRALEAFQAGRAWEITSVEIMEGNPFLRFMKPIITEKGCLKCHAAQGYREGDIRVGISVSVPFAPYLDIAGVQKRRLLLTHGIIGLLGVSGIWFAGLLLVRSRERLRSERDQLMQEVTVRKQMEEALRASEERLRAAGKVAYDLIYEWDVPTDHLEWFGDIDRFLGYGKGEISRDINAWLHLIHPEDVGQLADAVEIHRTSKKPILYDYRIRHNDGTYRHWNDHGTPLLDDQGRPYKWVGVCTDVTVRVQAEAALKQSEARFRELADLLPQIVFESDAQGRLTYANQIGFQSLGYTEEDFKSGLNMLDMLVPEERDKAGEIITRKMAGEDIQAQEYTFLRKNGTTFPAIIYSSSIRQGATSLGLRGIIVDITERKRLEDQVRQRLIALTQPEIDIKDLALTDIVALDLLQRLQDAFAEAFNMPSIIYGPKGTPITKPSCFTPFCKFVRSTERGAARCEAFDEELMRALRENHTPQIRRGCALTNMVTGTVPIVIQDRHLANWTIGQMVNHEHDPDEIRRYAPEIGLDEETLMAAAKTLVPVNDEAFERAVEFLNVLAGQISLLAIQNVQQGRDIARREQAEAELLESRKHYQSLFDSAGDAITVLDAEGVVRSCNPAAQALYARSDDEIVGKHVTEFMDPASIRLFKEKFPKLKQGEPQEGEIRIVRPDGSSADVLRKGTPLFDAKKNVIGVLTIDRDITERRQAEERARRTLERRRRESEAVAAVATSDHLAQGRMPELARVLTEAAAGALEVERVGVWLFDKEETELVNVDNYVLSTGEHSSGAVLKEAEYRNEFDLLKQAKYVDADDPLSDPRTAGYVEGYLKPNRISAMLDAVIRRGGKHLGTLCFEQVDRPHHWEADEIGFACELADQAALAVSNREYRQMQEEKSRLEEQYRQAQKLESIGRLAGGVAHDLNNLLTPILGYSEMLREETAADDPARASLNAIVNAGMRARDLVHQLLAFSRKQVLEYKRTDLNWIVAGFESLLRRTIPEDIRLEVIPSSTGLPVTVDVGQIEQVILNLAVNAADAMPDGGTITIETAAVHVDEAYAEARNGVEPGAYALLAVSDTGHGMDEETLARVFEPFFSTKGERGTGLGLATVYGIVKQHGGNIWVYSETGKGTTFKVYLPLAETKAAHPEDPTGSPTTADLTGSETILLVEDNEQVRELSLAILHRQGYRVITAENGREALAVLDRQEGPVHLLLTDVVMPEMNGRELFVKAAEKRPGLKVLFMSGYTDNVIAHRGVLDQGVAFIQKPFSVKDLAAKVREVLDQ